MSYKSIPMTLNVVKLREDVVRALRQAGYTIMNRNQASSILCDLLESQSPHGLMYDDSWLPTMRNFLALVNLLDLDPRDYFMLDVHEEYTQFDEVPF